MPAADPLAVRLQALEDREAIRDLIARYGPAADSGDADGVAALFDEAGVYAVGGMGESCGRPAIAALIHGPVHQQLMADGCAHLLGPVAIDLAGDTATARGLSLVFRWNGSHWDTVRASANRWHLARSDTGWAVTRRDNALLVGSAAARALLGAG
jgi:uncharacterized protein (TIGR02246 family)